MQFRLQTLLIFLVVGPPLLAAVVFVIAFLITPWEEGPLRIDATGRGRSGIRFTFGDTEILIPSD